MIENLERGAIVCRTGLLSNPLVGKQSNSLADSIICFVHNYAHERQGAAQGYRTLAALSVEREIPRSSRYIKPSDVRRVWEVYKELAGKYFPDLSLNPTNNPINEDKGVLSVLCEDKTPNLYGRVTNLLTRGEAKAAHDFIKQIRGVGNKIAAFYLRDIVCIEKIPEDELDTIHLIQPVDTWVRQAYSVVMGKNLPQDQIEAMKDVADLCKAAQCSHVEFNQGAWACGSLLGKDIYHLRRIAEGFDDRIRESFEEVKNLAKGMAKYFDTET